MDELAPFRQIPGNEHVLGKLKDLISSGNAIAFVGAGASAGKYPLWIPLLHELADLAVERDNAEPRDRDYWLREASSDPLGVAERIKAALGSGIFYSRLEAIFRPRTDGSFTDAHKKLASLPFKGFVTTNYDRGLVDAWQVTHSGAGSKTVSTRLNDVATSRWLTGEIYRQDPQPILHAHGVIDDTKSLVLTLDDYKDAYQSGKLYRRLFERLIIQDNLVFIGFGFTDPWMFFLSQTILRDIHGTETGSAPRHIAVIGLPGDRQYTREQRRKLEQEYDAEIVFYPVEVSTVSGKRHEDHSALAVLLSTLGPPVLPSPQTGGSPAPEFPPRAGSPGPAAPPPTVRSGPPFARRRVKATHESRFYFGAQRVPLLGRDKEKAELQRFLADEGRLRWWLMAGPGGIGKSRLALELVEDCGSEWDAGFLDQSTVFDWTAWSPTKLTLVVVDYVAQRPELTGDVIRQLYNREDQLSHAVRFLLLERESEGRWADEFYRTGSARSLLGDCRFAAPLTLAALTTTDLWEIIARELKSAGRPVPNRSSTLSALQSVDPGGRPLFAAFLADALAAGRTPREWDMQSLVRDVLAREAETRWKPAGITDQDLNLLALSTMTGGLSIHQARARAVTGILPEAARISAGRHAILTGQTQRATLAALEPDLIGEMLVLDHLSKAEEQIPGIGNQLAQLSWSIDPIKFAGFLDRAAKDFVRHPTLHLLDSLPECSPVPAQDYARAAVNLLFAYGNAGDIPAAHLLLDRINAVATDHPDLPMILEVHATAITLMCILDGNAGDTQAARLLLDRVDTLAAGHSDKPLIRQQYARAAANLAVFYGKAGDLPAARALVDRLAALAAEHPDEPVIREQYAKAVLNLANAYHNASDIPATRPLVDRLETLAAQHPDEPAVREQYARALLDLLVAYGNAGDIPAARALLDRLAAFAAEHPDEPVIREQYAKAALNLASAYGNAGDIPAKQALVDRLETLAADHPDEPAVRAQYAQGLIDLLVAYGDSGDITAARALLDRLDSITREHLDEAAILIVQPTAIAMLAIYCGVAGDIPAARSLLDRLDGLTAHHPDKPLIREGYANAASSLSAHYGNAGDIPAAQALVDRLDALAADHPEEPAVRELYAKAAFNLSTDYANAGDIPAVQALVDRLDALAADHPEEPAVREQYAKAAFNLSTDYANAGDIPAVQALVDRLDALAADHPEEPAVHELYAKAAFNLSTDYANAGDIPAAQALVDRLDALAADHPEEPAVHELYAEAAFSLSIDYAKAGDIPAAQALVDRLDALAADHPEEPAVREQYAKAAFNLSTDYANAGDIPAAQALVDRLDALAADHPEEPAVREQYAKAAFNLSTDYANAGDIPAAQALVDRLDALAADHPEEPAVREQYAKAAFNLSTDYGNAGDIPAAQALVDRLDALAAEHPDEPAVREQYASAAFNLSIDYTNAGNAPAARGLIDRLAVLAVAHPDEPEICRLASEAIALPTDQAEAPLSG